jgi:hypothetical protein
MQERRSMLPESLRTIANMLEDMQRIQRLTESRLSSHGAALEELKAELQRQIYVQERQAKEIYRLKQELDSLKSAYTTQESKNQKEAPAMLSYPAPAKASAEETAAVPQDAVRVVQPIPEKFFKAASTQNYITASVPLNSETRPQPQTGSTVSYTAPAAVVSPAATAATPSAATVHPVTAVSPTTSVAVSTSPATESSPTEALPASAATSSTASSSSTSEYQTPTGSSASADTPSATTASKATVTALPASQSGKPEQQPLSKAVPDTSRPILPGSGFSHITIDFLRKLGEK